MSNFWYFATGGTQRGPMSLAEMLPLLERVGDPRHVMVWRHGFDDWKPVEDVSEIAQQLFKPPPLRPPPVPLRTAAMPVSAPRDLAVDPVDLKEFRRVEPLSGIGGWLAFLAFGQVVGIFKLIATVVQYIQSITDEVWQRYATGIWVEIVMNVALIGLCIYTTALLFKHSRKFPSFFIAQMIFGVLTPIVDIFWVAIYFSNALNQPFSTFFTVEPKEGGQMIAVAISAALWIPYVLRSRRVANTFTK